MIPLHIGLIPDGNRRFALRKNINLEVCYNNSVEKALSFADWCYELGASSVTMYAFSVENFKRSQEEISILYSVFCRMFDKMMNDESLHYKVLVRGNRELLRQHFDSSLLNKINAIEEKTAGFTDFTLVLLIGYGARDELLQCVTRGEPTMLQIETYPKVNLLIRTAGEFRTSNFPFSPDAYFFSCKKYFPLLKRRDLQKAIKISGLTA